jgi:hypothetical protein
VTKFCADITTQVRKDTHSEVLSGRCRLITRHISILARYFRIHPGLFLDTAAELHKPNGVGPRASGMDTY